MKKTTGFVIGKFMPLHKGHTYLIDFAKNIVDELTVLVDNLPDNVDTMTLNDRYNIVKKTYPDLNIKKIDQVTFQEPEDSENFWEFWKETIIRNVGYKPDYIIGSMDYIKKLAEVLDCEYIMVDKERIHLPISATLIRNAYNNYYLGLDTELKKVYKFIPPETIAHFSRDVYIVGGESTGKTTLAKKIAEKMNTIYVPEYATYYIKEHGKLLKKQDFINILLGQLASQRTLIKESFVYSIHDTDLITTKIWYRKFFGDDNLGFFDDYIKKQRDGLYLILDNSISWKDDEHRYFPTDSDRDWFYEQFIIELQYYNKKYIVVNDRNENIIGKIKSHY